MEPLQLFNGLYGTTVFFCFFSLLVFMCLKTSLHLLRFFRRILAHGFAVKLKKCRLHVGEKIMTVFFCFLYKDLLEMVSHWRHLSQSEWREASFPAV